MTLTWVQGMSGNSTLWHVGEVRPDSAKYYSDYRRLCRPASDAFYAREWTMQRAGDYRHHPLGPATHKSDACARCVAKTDDVNAVVPPLPTEQQSDAWRAEKALRMMHGKARSVRTDDGWTDEYRSLTDHVDASDIRHHLPKIRLVDPDRAADLARLADDFELALRKLLPAFTGAQDVNVDA